MRILLVNRFFDDSQTPTGRMLRDLAGELVAQGHEVQVLASSGSYAASRGARPSGRSTPTHPRLRVISVPTPARGRIGPWIAFLAQVALRVPAMRWDRIVLLTDPPMLGVVALVTARPRHGVFLWTMDLYPEALAAHGMLPPKHACFGLLQKLNDAVLRRADGVITLGSAQTTRLRRYPGWMHRSGARHLEVPPWDDRRIPYVAPEANRFVAEQGIADRKIVLYAGNLGEAHGFEEIVAAAALLATQPDSRWLFVFVVRGARRRALEQAARCCPNVLVLDYVAPALTPDLLWSAHVHLITMRRGWEGIVVPSKLYGVLMTDAPVLFVGPPDADTAREIERYDRGISVPPGASAECIAEALAQLDGMRKRARRPEHDGPRRIADFVGAPLASPQPAPTRPARTPVIVVPREEVTD